MEQRTKITLAWELHEQGLPLCLWTFTCSSAGLSVEWGRPRRFALWPFLFMLRCDMADVQAELWGEMARQAILSAEERYTKGDFRGSANRSYYASYQAATAASIKYGDANQFPNGR